MTKPHSDKSARAQRRAAARELAKAPERAVPAQMAQPGQISVSIPDLLAKIGALVVERDVLQNQVIQLRNHIQGLVEELGDGEAEEGSEIEELGDSEAEEGSEGEASK